MSEIFLVFSHILLFVTLYFEVFLLLTLFENKQELRRGAPAPRRLPSVSILVPCWNEAKTLVETINSLLALDYPKNKLFISIIDDGSTDSTWRVAQRFRKHPQVKLFQKENGGKWTALNFGLLNTSSELVGCLDADSLVAPDALLNIVERFSDLSIMAVTPNIQVHEPQTLLQHIQKAEYSLSVFIRKCFAILGSVYITPGPFSIFRREVFEKIGPYKHAHHTEDMEIAMRMQLHGMKIDNAHDAVIYTKTPHTIRKLFKQRLRWVYGFLNNALDHKQFFFKKEFGNLGLFILPMAALSVFSALYFAGYAIWNAGILISNKITEVSAVGLSLPHFNLDLFFFNTQSIFFISIVLLSLTLGIILTGKFLTEGKIRFTRDILYFFAFYSFLAPLWLAGALYNTIFSRSITWR
ncbi:MAG: glycosyltransferase [Patescibacteria group bacterium]